MTTATLTPCRGRVRLCTGSWSDTFPVDQLPRWLAFYRRMRDRNRGRYARFYAPTVEALEAVQAEAGKCAS